MTTNLNSGYFSAYQFRHRPANVIRRSLSARRPHRIDSNSSIFFVDRNNDRILRRNDFANNQLFLTKQKLTKILSNGRTPSAESTDELLNLFDRHRSNPQATSNEVEIFSKKTILVDSFILISYRKVQKIPVKKLNFLSSIFR